MSDTDSWCTPPEITVPLHDTLYQGPATVDPFSNERSLVKALRSYFTGGFTLPWWLVEKEEPGNDFENPPYSKMTAATAKLLVELKSGRVVQHVRLVPAMTSSRWWARQCLDSKRNPRVMFTKRISFLDPFNPDPNKRRQTCRHEPALVYYGSKPALFDKAFKHLNRWSTWGR